MSFNIFGIDIGAHSLKVAVVEKQFRGYEVVRLARRKIEGLSEADISAVLEKTLADLGFDKDEDHVAAVMPADKLSSRTFDIPLTRRRQIAETLPFEIESQTPFNAKDIVCDFVLLETTAAGSKILAVIALKSQLISFLSPLGKAGADPDTVTPAPLAAAAALSQDLREGEYRILLDIGYRSTVITIVEGLSPVTFHVAPIGAADIIANSGFDEGAMEKALDRSWPREPEAEKLSAAINTFCVSIASEVKRSFLSLGVSDEMAGEASLISYGGLGHSEMILEALKTRIGVSAARGKPPSGEAFVDEDPATIRKSPDVIFAGALGAALRMADGARFEQVNLRTGELEKKRKLTRDKNNTIMAGILLFLAIAMGLASYIVEGARLGAKYEALQQDIRAHFKRALPEVTRIVAENQQLKNALEKLNEKSKSLGAGLMDKDPFLDRLLDISKAAPENMRLDIDELLYEWGSVTMAGRTESFNKVEKLKEKLEKLPWARKVTVEKAKASTAANTVNFKIEVKTYL